MLQPNLDLVHMLLVLRHACVQNGTHPKFLQLLRKLVQMMLHAHKKCCARFFLIHRLDALDHFIFIFSA
jgi:hypothetical protein